MNRWVVIPIFLLGASSALAMPQFSRRENMSCSGCHTQIPRLNRFGYEYRQAGFRVPENLGKEEKPFSLEELFGARVQVSGDYSHRDDNGASSNNGQLQFREFTMYPLTGAWGRYFSSLTELSVAPEDFFEVENAYVKANLGTPDHMGWVRLGIAHPFEGYGGSDRPLGLARSLIQTTAANHNQSTLFTPWGLDQVGLSAGYLFRGFSAAFTVWNGNFVRSEEGGAVKVFPAQGGELLKTATVPSNNHKDFQLFVNQMVGERFGISAYYYRGWLDLPKDPKAELTPANLWQNGFDRFALYGYLQPHKHLALQAGGQLGIDHFFDANAAEPTGGTFYSGGLFGELLVPMREGLAGAVRYDFFDPSSRKDNNELHAVTAALNWAAQNGLQLIGQYRFVDTSLGAGKSDRQDHSLQLRLIFIL